MERLSLNETTAAERQRAAQLVCGLPPETYYELHGRGLFSEAMDAAMRGGQAGLKAFLASNGVGVPA